MNGPIFVPNYCWKWVIELVKARQWWLSNLNVYSLKTENKFNISEGEKQPFSENQLIVVAQAI